jgi:hypothetical protein
MIEGERKGKRRSPILGVVLIFASFMAAAYIWVGNSGESQKKTIARLEGFADRLRSETVPVKFMVLSRDSGEIRARFKLFDLSGRELSVLEKSWKGTELYVDVLLVPIASGKDAKRADSWLALPYRVFTDEIPAASGTLLFDDYDVAGFPEVLRGVDWSAKEESSLKAAFAEARKAARAGLPASEALKGSFGSAAHEVSRLSKFEEGIVYKVVCRVKGGVEIMEE